MLSYTCSFQGSVVVRRVASYLSIIWWIFVVFAIALLLEGIVPYFADIMIYIVNKLGFRDAVFHVGKVFLLILLSCTKHENNSM
jgi:hypothetical protein